MSERSPGNSKQAGELPNPPVFQGVTRFAVALLPRQEGAERRSLGRHTQGKRSLELFRNPDGSIEAQYADGIAVWTLARTHPVEVSARADNELNVYGSPGRYWIALESDELPAYNPAVTFPLLICVREFDDPPALQHPEARAVCQHWIEWRAKRFSLPLPVRSDNRPATFEEQLDQLRAAAEDLDRHCDVLDAGGPGLLAAFKGLMLELRSLVYWKEQNDRGWQSYNPLLLRLADKASLPLPVYGVRELGVIESSEDAADSYLIRARAAVPTRIRVDSELMDLQEWLQLPAVVTATPAEGKALENRSIKGVILLANVALGGHYDQDVPVILDLMRSFSRNEVHTLARFLAETGRTVAGLSRYVIEELEAAGVRA